VLELPAGPVDSTFQVVESISPVEGVNINHTLAALGIHRPIVYKAHTPALCSQNWLTDVMLEKLSYR